MSGPPRMIVEIVFADDRTEHIEVRDGDDPGQLAREFPQVQLALSLHAPDDEVRRRIVPTPPAPAASSPRPLFTTRAESGVLE